MAEMLCLEEKTYMEGNYWLHSNYFQPLSYAYMKVGVVDFEYKKYITHFVECRCIHFLEHVFAILGHCIFWELNVCHPIEKSELKCHAKEMNDTKILRNSRRCRSLSKLHAWRRCAGTEGNYGCHYGNMSAGQREREGDWDWRLCAQRWRTWWMRTAFPPEK